MRGGKRVPFLFPPFVISLEIGTAGPFFNLDTKSHSKAANVGMHFQVRFFPPDLSPPRGLYTPVRLLIPVNDPGHDDHLLG